MPELTVHPYKIIQAYLFIEGDDHFRVRIKDDYHFGKKSAVATFKRILTPTDRIEINMPVTLEDAEKLVEIAPYVLEKERYAFLWNGQDTVIDIYPSGLKVVEVEYVEKLDMPPFCGKEITGQNQYSNIQIAKESSAKVIQTEPCELCGRLHIKDEICVCQIIEIDQ